MFTHSSQVLIVDRLVDLVCAPPVANSILFCFERDFMAFLSDDK